MHPRLAAAKQADAMTAMQEQLPVMQEELAALKAMSEAQHAQLDRIEALLKSAVEAEPEAAPEKPASKKAEKA
jgi:predicted short-subunit dehydrogenase-like oxidoreductase (DUF2520 family)